MSTSKPNARAQNGKLLLVVVLVLRSKGPYYDDLILSVRVIHEFLQPNFYHPFFLIRINSSFLIHLAKHYKPSMKIHHNKENNRGETSLFQFHEEVMA